MAMKMEAYCLASIEGIKWNHHEQILHKCASCSFLILNKLLEAVRPFKLGRMHYANFENQITKRFAVVCEGWPLSQFESPHHLHSLPQLEILYNAWVNGAARFHKLTAKEHAIWLAVYEAKLNENPTERGTLQTDDERVAPAQPIITPDTINQSTCDSTADPASASTNVPAQPVVPSVTTSTGVTVPTRGRKWNAPALVGQHIFALEGQPSTRKQTQKSGSGKSQRPQKGSKKDSPTETNLPDNADGQIGNPTNGQTNKPAGGQPHRVQPRKRQRLNTDMQGGPSATQGSPSATQGGPSTSPINTQNDGGSQSGVAVASA
ncbi:hypothetical protein QCA50_018898 [Cerrena zonata]|uniref:Uncharacterized protein n=1 Tax=Cerrena zonata TaxID=2478898 RepID=A0AAW0FA71_9APHY